MSEKRINIIIVIIVIISIIVSYELMQHSPKRTENKNIEIKQVDKIAVFNKEISDNINNNKKGYFTVYLNNYELNGNSINMNINVKSKQNDVYAIDSIVIGERYVDINHALTHIVETTQYISGI